jgi:hypothetical protein
VTARTYTDPPELAHMSGQFKLGYRQGREEERNAALEEAAKACEAYDGTTHRHAGVWNAACDECAAAIRGLKT